VGLCAGECERSFEIYTRDNPKLVSTCIAEVDAIAIIIESCTVTTGRRLLHISQFPALMGTLG